MPEKKKRSSSIELLRVLCMLFIIADHFAGQSGIREGGLPAAGYYEALSSLSRVACSVFVIISAWFDAEREEFRLEKLGRVWLTAFMYLVPVTFFLYRRSLASGLQLYTALLPLEGGSLWFVSCFLQLQCLAPALKLLVRKQKRLSESLLLFFGITLTGYATLTGRQGVFTSDLWVMIYLYTLTLYWKRWGSGTPKPRACAAVFFPLWALLLAFRLFSSARGYTTLMAYSETFRSCMQSLPNMALAYCLFFGFLGWDRRESRIVSTMASCTLGVYCFHQIPAFYPILWTKLLRSTAHAALLSGGARLLYTVCAILLTALLGMAVELLRARLSRLLIEDRKWYRRLCERFNRFVNEAVRV
ncbi:MAG: acyltransferase [Oscillospiraceae bacterium]|nr:acyltransferase [Oscillospiraceae bacterium]